MAISIATFGLITTAALLSLFRLPGFLNRGRQDSNSIPFHIPSTKKPMFGQRDTQIPINHLMNSIYSPHFQMVASNVLSSTQAPIMEHNPYWNKFFGRYKHHINDDYVDMGYNEDHHQTDESEPVASTLDETIESKSTLESLDNCKEKVNYHYHMYLVKEMENNSTKKNVTKTKPKINTNIVHLTLNDAFEDVVTRSNYNLIYPMFDVNQAKQSKELKKNESNIFRDDHQQKQHYYNKILLSKIFENIKTPASSFKDSNFNSNDSLSTIKIIHHLR